MELGVRKRVSLTLGEGRSGLRVGLIQEFGAARVRDTPISEAGFVGLAAGLAAAGYRPWVDVMFTELLPLASDQIANRIARTRYLSAGQIRMPLTIKTFGECYSPLCHYPGLICVAPSDAYSAKGLVTAALRCDDPVVVFDSLRLLRHEDEVPEHSYALEIGRSRVLREGADVTLLGIGPLYTALPGRGRSLAAVGRFGRGGRPTHPLAVGCHRGPGVGPADGALDRR